MLQQIWAWQRPATQRCRSGQSPTCRHCGDPLSGCGDVASTAWASGGWASAGWASGEGICGRSRLASPGGSSTSHCPSGRPASNTPRPAPRSGRGRAPPSIVGLQMPPGAQWSPALQSESRTQACLAARVESSKVHVDTTAPNSTTRARRAPWACSGRADELKRAMRPSLRPGHRSVAALDPSRRSGARPGCAGLEIARVVATGPRSWPCAAVPRRCGRDSGSPGQGTRDAPDARALSARRRGCRAAATRRLCLRRDLCSSPGRGTLRWPRSCRGCGLPRLRSRW